MCVVDERRTMVKESEGGIEAETIAAWLAAEDFGLRRLGPRLGHRQLRFVAGRSPRALQSCASMRDS